jgi:hypothetical protein
MLSMMHPNAIITFFHFLHSEAIIQLTSLNDRRAVSHYPHFAEQPLRKS